MFSLNQSHPPALSAATNMPAPGQAQLTLDTHTPQSKHITPALPVHNHLLRTSLGQVDNPNSATITSSKERHRITSGISKMSCTMHQKGDQAELMAPAILVKLFLVQHNTKRVYLKRKPDCPSTTQSHSLGLAECHQIKMVAL